MDIPFPRPDLIAGNRRYWMRGTVRRWRAEQAGLPAPAQQPDDEAMLNSRQVRDLFGGVSHMWIERRLKPKTEVDQAVTAGA
jgi:hypothetical protein